MNKICLSKKNMNSRNLNLVLTFCFDKIDFRKELNLIAVNIQKDCNVSQDPV